MSDSVATAFNDGDSAGNLTDAAVKVQSLFRGNRARRNLADSSMMAEDNWVQALEFANQSRRTISFFDSAKPESPVARWNRVGSHCSKLGKGLSKDDKAQQMIFRNWIEAIDPKHRYGKNLQAYYNEWCKSESLQPFFYWLDIGDGKDVELEKCPRSKLKDQCVKYLGPKEREKYEYIVVDGKFINKLSGEALNTQTEGGWEAGMLFVVSTCKRLYVGEKKRGKFHHSSFLAGATTVAAGTVVVEDGILKSIAPFTGHYKTSDERLQNFLTFFKDNGVNLDEVQVKKTSEFFYYPEDKSSFNSRTTPTTPTTPLASEPNITTNGQGISAA